jgi:hypothetical protein
MNEAGVSEATQFAIFGWEQPERRSSATSHIQRQQGLKRSGTRLSPKEAAQTRIM